MRIKHSSKLVEQRTEEGSYWFFWCPACERCHSIPTPRWAFNGKTDCPTFTPSLRLLAIDSETKKESTVCHLNVTDGQIVFHGDCPHEFKGRTVPMQDIPADYDFGE